MEFIVQFSKQAIGVLQDIEWIGRFKGAHVEPLEPVHFRCCPVCGGVRPDRTPGGIQFQMLSGVPANRIDHDRDCSLARILRDGEITKQEIERIRVAGRPAPAYRETPETRAVDKLMERERDWHRDNQHEAKG